MDRNEALQLIDMVKYANIMDRNVILDLIDIVKNALFCLVLLELVLHPHNCHLTSGAHCIMETTRCSMIILRNDTLNAHTDHSNSQKEKLWGE